MIRKSESRVTEAAFPPDTRPRTRPRRSRGSRTRRTRRRSAVQPASSLYALLLSRGQIREQVEGARHEHGRILPRPLDGGHRVVDDLDLREPTGRPGGELRGRQSPWVRGCGRNEVLARPREALEDPVHVFVAKDRRDDRVAPRGEARQRPVHAVRVVRTVPDLKVGATLEPAWQLDVHLPGGTRPKEGTCGFPRAPEQHLRAGDEVGELGVGQNDDRVVAGDGELLAGDLFSGFAEHFYVIQPDVREQDDAGVDHVCRVMASAANSANAAAVSTSNCVAPAAAAAFRTRPIARSKSASSPPARIRSLQPRTCGERYAPTFRPAAARCASIVLVAVDLPLVPTTWIEGYFSSGWPSVSSSIRMRPRPNSSGHGSSDATQSAPDGIALHAARVRGRAERSTGIAGRCAETAE